MKSRRTAAAALTVACVFGMTAASATAAGQHAGVASTPVPSSATTAQSTPNGADTEFVSMMIPHHFQALVMSGMVPDRSQNDDLRAMADRIEVEQTGEIATMQRWQQWHGLEVTDAETAYQMMLDNPQMLEQMGMATPEELSQLSTLSGQAFDILFLELMIEHHEGGIDMAIDVIVNGSDQVLQQMATDMMMAQYTQNQQMQAMLDDLR